MAWFTQEDINQGVMFYCQQITGTSDRVELEATNGVTKIGSVWLEMDIVPSLLPLQVCCSSISQSPPQSDRPV